MLKPALYADVSGFQENKFTRNLALNKTSKLVNSLTLKRRAFFQEIANLVPRFNGKFIIVTHILNDRPELLEAINQIGEVALVIAIPYSINLATLDVVKKKYLVITPNLTEMRDEHFLMNAISQLINLDSRLIILEIGGYFAPLVTKLRNKLGNHFIGVIESTEAGHRQYEKILASLSCPIISVCRGSLKKTEYSVVGSSCVFSAERLIRKTGFLLQGKNTLVIGFGKVGQGLARALSRFNCNITVYDTNPILRVLAYSEGFQVPEKDKAIINAQIIFGATGNEALSKQEISLIKKGCILISTSSKDIEFDMNYINSNYVVETPLENIDVYSNNEHFFYMLGQGLPINFLDGAVMGPVLALVQSEIIFAVKALVEAEKNHLSGIFEIRETDRQMLATKWLQYFNQNELSYLYEYL